MSDWYFKVSQTGWALLVFEPTIESASKTLEATAKERIFGPYRTTEDALRASRAVTTKRNLR